MPPIGANLAAIRTRKDLTTEQLSVASGVAEGIISQIEAGEIAATTVATLDQLCTALQIPFAALFRALPTDDHHGATTPPPAPTPPEIVGESAALKTVLEQAAVAAQHDEPVLITGETGTGKNLLASYIHALSRRASQPFIVIPCTFPENLAQAELFGHVRGAFTGSVGQKPGAFEVAGRGTILLDEIGALPIHLQPLLLRVIESKLVKRVGDARDVPVYCRVLASTNEYVQRAIRENRLRSDLYYRFRWRIHIPPLRERAEDIPFLARYFLNYDCDRLGIPRKHFDADALAALVNYPWPGNIRQLESALDILAITVEKTVITAQELRELFSRYGDEPTVAVETSELFKTKRIPYYFGPPVSDPSRFFGRKDELEGILQLLQQSEFGNYWPIAVYGDHRMGKSSLLRILDAKIPSTLRCLSTYIDIAAVSQNQFFAVIVKRVAELVYAAAGMGTIERALREIKDSGAWHAAFGEINVDIMGFLKFKAAPSSEQHWERFVTILEALRARLDDYGTYHSIVLIFDEVSACANWTGSAELLKNWRSHIQALKGYNFIVADAHPLYQVSKDKWSAFFNVFSPVLLKGLAPEETIDLIVKPAAETGVQYAPPAVARIRELSGGKPFYVQVICCTVFERLLKDRNTTYVTAGLVESCIDGVLDRLGEHFVAFWSNLTDFQKEYLLSIVHKQSVDLAPRSKTKLFEEQRTQIKRLEERQLVTVDEYKIARIDPLLREWINRYYT